MDRFRKKVEIFPNTSHFAQKKHLILAYVLPNASEDLLLIIAKFRQICSRPSNRSTRRPPSSPSPPAVRFFFMPFWFIFGFTGLFYRQQLSLSLRRVDPTSHNFNWLFPHLLLLTLPPPCEFIGFLLLRVSSTLSLNSLNRILFL